MRTGGLGLLDRHIFWDSMKKKRKYKEFMFLSTTIIKMYSLERIENDL